MDRMLSDAAGRLRPILAPPTPTICAFVPLPVLHLERLSARDREQRVRQLSPEEQLLVWKLVRLEWEDTRARWVSSGRSLVLSQPAAAAQRLEEAREWSAQAPDWETHPLEWEDGCRSTELISNQWFEVWQWRRRLWAISLSH